MILMYNIFYKDATDGFKEIHFHSRVSYRETAITVCRLLETEDKKPWFQFVKVEE